jgi:hypothetical protein
MHKDTLMIFFIVLFFSVASYSAGFYISKGHTIKVIDNMLNEIGHSSREPLTEDEFKDIQALLKVRKIFSK